MTFTDSIKLRIIDFDYWVKQSILSFIRNLFFKKLRKEHVHKILIFRTGSIGDSICSLPAIQAVRNNFQSAHITILYNSGGSTLASIESLLNHSIVDAFINYAEIPYKQLLKWLKKENFDTFIELPQVHQPFRTYLRNILFAKMIGAKYAMGWKIAATRVFPSIQDKYRKFVSVRDHFINILSIEGLEIPTCFDYPLGISGSDVLKINADFTHRGLDNKKLAGIVVGAKRPQNRWPVSYFDEVINFLLTKGYNILIIGGREDREIACKLENYNRLNDFTGELTPLQSAEALQRCKFVVTNDTGPMHLAYAVRTFVFAVFSSRDYKGLWYPPEERSVVLRNNNVSCTACFSEECKDNICMKGVKPAHVIAKIEKFIEAKKEKVKQF